MQFILFNNLLQCEASNFVKIYEAVISDYYHSDLSFLAGNYLLPGFVDIAGSRIKEGTI